MLFLDGVYVDSSNGAARFRWVKAPTSTELTRLAHTVALHVSVAACADERTKLERLCRYISTPAVSERRLSMMSNDNIRYDVKGFTSVAGAGMCRSDPVEDAVLGLHHPRHLQTARFYCKTGWPFLQPTWYSVARVDISILEMGILDREGY